MSDFKRSPSKVWWGEDYIDWRYRTVSASPGSQDSGFSDAETSPPQNQIQKKIPKQNNYEKTSTEQNLTINYKEKLTPDKNLLTRFNEQRLNKSVDSGMRKYYKTPQRHPEVIFQSEPTKKHKYLKRTSKASKNLFNVKDVIYDQYSHDINDSKEIQHMAVISNEVTFDDNSSKDKLSFVNSTTGNKRYQIFASTPLKIIKDEDAILKSDSDSELECLFHGSIKHTSTPKLSPRPKMRHMKNKIPLNLLKKYHDERIPPLFVLDSDNYQDSVQKWFHETKYLYEPECMTTLQCKSVSAELAQKVTQIAEKLSVSLREKLFNMEIVEKEFRNIKSQNKHIGPLAQSLAGSIITFLPKHTEDKEYKNISKLCEDLRRCNSENLIETINELYKLWKTSSENILHQEVQQIINMLEEPKSELDLRATLTIVTSLSLRHEWLIFLLVSKGVVQTLLILCEKCDGSSVRALILRGLSTICCNTTAVRQFEKASGIQIIAEILEEKSRPEPERSEAVALLAQITAPWIEDNQNVSGLSEKSRSLVKSLTYFCAKTKCCQNLLLCVAALANLTTMETKCIKYVLHQNTLKTVLGAVKRRGSFASVYLLEQVAMLIANMSTSVEARQHLTEEQAPTVIMCFLQSNSSGDDFEKRLQQKSMIALSRLCGNPDAARQVVDIGGISKLVKLCREKNERHDNDAVLVAALTTLRKIVETCGKSVISTQDAQELIEPRLLDSFLTYSTQNESYV